MAAPRKAEPKPKPKPKPNKRSDAKPRPHVKPKSTRTIPLSRELALRAAVALADREGLDALTMRKLAEEVGVEAMSLYHHVANKDEILDGMVDMVFAEIDLPRLDVGWKVAMSERGSSVRAALNRHPWSITIMESRASPGPATLRHHDAVIGCCRAAGFSLPMTAHAFSMIDSYIYGFVMQEVNLPFANGDDLHGLAASIEPLLAGGEYPHFVEFVTDHALQPGYAYGNEFAFGLDLILDGLATAARKVSRIR